MGQEAPQKETILSAAVAMGRPLLTAEEADQQTLQLLQQVADLECANTVKSQAIKVMEEQMKALASRNAALEDGIKAVSAQCSWRDMGFCDLLCNGRSFCKTDGLTALPLSPEHGEATSQ